MAFYRSTVLVSVDPICVEKGAYEIIDALHDELIKQGLIDEVRVLETPRLGDPQTEGPDMVVYPEGTHYINLNKEILPKLVEEHFIKGRILQDYAAPMVRPVDEELAAPKAKEVRVVLRNVGVVDPLNIEDYIANDGYMALGKVLTEMTPEEVIQEVLDAKLRGRGGAGFPTGSNGALQDRHLEILNTLFAMQMKVIRCFHEPACAGGRPHSVIEGMIIAAYAWRQPGLYLLPCRISHCSEHDEPGDETSPYLGFVRGKHNGLRLQLRLRNAYGRWCFRLR